MSAQREQWTGRTGFLLATIGGAVGIGNIWRFSYVAGENGGGAFLLVYLACVAVVALPLMIAELTIGRHAQGDAVTAFEIAGKPSRWRIVGWLGIAAAALLLSYYAVIAGWALKYFVGAATGALWATAAADYGAFFRLFIADRGEPIAWQAVALAIAMFVVAGGVRRGIERVNWLLIPLLAVLLVLLAGFAISLPGSSAGIAFLLSPDWSALREPRVYAAALGQAFFSLGVGMTFFITYGSYMGRSIAMPVTAVAVAVGDTLFAIVAGLAIFPAVLALGGDPAQGPELAFITLPQIFLKMPAGELVGAVFFLLLATAAITSMVALLEIPVAALTHRFRVRRWPATAAMGAAIFLLGLPSALSYGTLAGLRVGSRGILDAIDYWVSSFTLPAIGIATALYVGWRLQRAVVLEAADFGDSRLGRAWLWLLRVVVPVTILAILLQAAAALW
jgi:NSS family neurotransmitter:Na+ symporter